MLRWLRRLAPALLLLSCAAHGQPSEGDPLLARTVERAFALDPGLPAEGIEVAVAGGVVLLTGSVPNLLVAGRAAAVATAVPGVRSVVDRLALDDAPRHDSDIADALAAAFLAEPAAEGAAIHAEVHNGRVTLTGVVGSWYAARLAERLAQGLAGVTLVESNLSVEPVSGRSDAAILDEVRSSLRWDPRIDPRLVDVRVEAGRVRLAGWVGSIDARERAARDAYVGGVREVEVSGLAVRPDKVGRGAELPHPDRELRIALADALLIDPRTRDSRIQVAASAGRVTLSGEVAALPIARAAERTAWHTAGVVEVENLLRVRPARPARDETLGARVVNLLTNSPLISEAPIDILVTEGKVLLSGALTSTLERAEAERLVASVEGVTEVQNTTVLARTARPPGYNPYIEATLVEVGAPPAAAVSDEEDRAIAQRIRDRLFETPNVDSAKVAVRVERGIAFVSGTLSSNEERNAVSLAAIAAGAMAVRNLLAVDRREERPQQVAATH